MDDYEQKCDDCACNESTENVENAVNATEQQDTEQQNIDIESTVREESSEQQNFYSDSYGDGRGYTNPDGSHGFVYNDPSDKEPDRARGNRGVLIAVSVIVVTVLAVAGSCLGAWMAAKSLHPTGGQTVGSSVGEVGTLDGLYIENDTVSETEGVSNSPILTVTPPQNVTIVKKTASRVDANGDGKADIAYGEDGQVLTSAGDSAMSVATVVAKVSASVVEITTETHMHSGYVGQYVTSGAGSGVIISKEGYIVTNHHVVDGANTITVRMSDGKEFAAQLVGSDQKTDIAVLWINAGNYPLTVATMGSSYDLVVGEEILAIGNPLGSLGGTVTEGMISATEREIKISGTNMTLLQISAPINPGNSGGGLFNLAGELVGIVNAKMASEEIEGLGFAVPSDTAYAVICALINRGYASGRPALGVTLTELVTISGTKYVRVEDKNHAVLKDQDLILLADGVRISSIADLAAIVYSKSVGDTVKITVYRDGRQQELIVPIIAWEDYD